MLQLQTIEKQLDSILISDISFKIEDGEYFVLLGPSGEGKTVLLEILALEITHVNEYLIT